MYQSNSAKICFSKNVSKLCDVPVGFNHVPVEKDGKTGVPVRQDVLDETYVMTSMSQLCIAVPS